ncbi:hypothetical protein, conserved [Eimeria maxima]|uniref:Uncharacterized protein n=1 Tax=Eimeria maxima TaxID=5804 RepID=U6MC49_EIMMA|nr:hypothetical protein, conserved [Eimeria maxima]CDJ61591.1 hypothetical protein, conserved [Eimeria maxima]
MDTSLAIEEMREVIPEGEGEDSILYNSAEEEEEEENTNVEHKPPYKDIQEVKDVLDTWWPSSAIYDFDKSLEAAKKKAKKPLGLWGIETIDRKELVRLLNLDMERYIAKDACEWVPINSKTFIKDLLIKDLLPTCTAADAPEDLDELY